MSALQEVLIKHLTKWQNILRLRDWDIHLEIIHKSWRKTGDIKIDLDDKKAILMVNGDNPRKENLEEVVIHELLHLKLYRMDQMLELLLEGVFGKDRTDPKYDFAYGQFMNVLESTVEDLTKGYMTLGSDDPSLSFGRVDEIVKDELNK